MIPLDGVNLQVPRRSSASAPTSATASTSSMQSTPASTVDLNPPSSNDPNWLNPYSNLIQDQKIAIVDHFRLESKTVLQNVPVAYKTWGSLDSSKSNVMIICHALSGSSDVEDWWQPLIGKGVAFDPSRFFIFCGNALGSPYGSASSLTIDPKTGKPYGPHFPKTTIRDDCHLQKLVLEALGVQSVAMVIGGSMGGMLVLEWALLYPEYVRAIVPISTSARHSAWCISWGEAQRQSIYSDPKYKFGNYPLDDPPLSGLAAARMSALLTYRSRDSFEKRFARAIQSHKKKEGDEVTSEQSETANTEETKSEQSIIEENHIQESPKEASSYMDHQYEHNEGITPSTPGSTSAKPQYFTAQSYLRYQGQRFCRRFDSNCYIHITRKLDTHDVTRKLETDAGTQNREESVEAVLSRVKIPTLVLGIETDALFTFAEQKEIAECIPNARLEKIESGDGHDGFLLEFGQVNQYILDFEREVFPDLMSGSSPYTGDMKATKKSLFGESETIDEITQW